jgi:hypothetical protein
MNDYTAEIERLYNEQEALKRNELEAQKQQALTQVEREQAKVMPTYTAAKQQASVQSQLGAKNLAEYWASRGQANAGITPQSEMSRQNTLAGQLGQIGQQEQQALQGFGEQRTDISTQYGSQLASELGQIGTAKSTALYNEKLRQDEEKAAREAAIAKAQIEAQRYADQLKQQEFENNMAIRKYNLDVAKANGKLSEAKNKPTEGDTRYNKNTGKTQEVVNGEWVDIKYATRKNAKGEIEVINKKQEKFNKQGYFMNTPDEAVSFNNITPYQIGKKKDQVPVKKLTYQTWINKNDGEYYIIKNDKPIQLTDIGLQKAVDDKLLTPYQVGQIKIDFANSLQS